jgi:hypothetical protein
MDVTDCCGVDGFFILAIYIEKWQRDEHGLLKMNTDFKLNLPYKEYKFI